MLKVVRKSQKLITSENLKVKENDKSNCKAHDIVAYHNNLLHPNICMHIVHTIYTFSKVLTRRICYAIQSVFRQLWGTINQYQWQVLAQDGLIDPFFCIPSCIIYRSLLVRCQDSLALRVTTFCMTPRFYFIFSPH